MKTIKSTVVALTMGMMAFGAISISANEAEEHNVMVQIHKASDSNTKVELDIDSQVQVFNLPDLEIGETKDIVTESGSTISVTKTDSGISVYVDGEEINLPSVGGDMAAHFIKSGMPLHEVNEGIQVIGDLTDEQIAIIRDGFAAAGVEKEVNFTKGHEMRFITIDGKEGGNYEFDFSTDKENNHWISEDGANVKIIKMGDGHGKKVIKSEIIVVDKIHEDN